MRVRSLRIGPFMAARIVWPARQVAAITPLNSGKSRTAREEPMHVTPAFN